ncbi:MAG TPA: 3-hydroxyacyl-CoA dehydrogenase family protein [Candidatus Nitrosotenuis sp.]|nr:3-hydroxyacyl-CoA dehydrogenase family protein [Candidatus Nitrosotenuis sp.]
MDIKTVAVIGSGTMGSGIAQVAAMAGYDVFLNDVEEGFLDRAMKAIRASLDKLVSKGKLSAVEGQAALDRLKLSADIQGARQADLVIEAITEQMAAKRELFARLDQLCKPEAILATNTSSLSVTELSLATRRPQLFCGMHFFNPPVLMKLVEIVRTPMSSPATLAAATEVARRMGKTPLVCRDTPGFLFNRLIIPYLNEAMWAVHEGVGGIAEIDQAMILGGNMPIGPLSLLDLVGIDVQLHACESLYEQFRESKFRPCPLNRYMVRAGYLGRKAGKGFYDYSTDPPTPVDLSVFRA